MTKSPYQAIIRADFASIGIKTSAECLQAIDFFPNNTRQVRPQTEIALQVVESIERYLVDPGYRFNLPLDATGTIFQQRVWQALAALKPGETITYGELARQLDTGPRAIGNACRRNPIPLVVPCHRVVAKNGQGGYAGDTQGGWTVIKHWLLQHEAGI